MKKYSKVVKLNNFYKGAQKITLDEFLDAFFIFLKDVKVVKNEDEFMKYVFNNQNELDYFIEKFNLILKPK